MKTISIPLLCLLINLACSNKGSNGGRVTDLVHKVRNSEYLGEDLDILDSIDIRQENLNADDLANLSWYNAVMRKNYDYSLSLVNKAIEKKNTLAYSILKYHLLKDNRNENEAQRYWSEVEDQYKEFDVLKLIKIRRNNKSIQEKLNSYMDVLNDKSYTFLETDNEYLDVEKVNHMVILDLINGQLNESDTTRVNLERLNFKPFLFDNTSISALFFIIKKTGKYSDAIRFIKVLDEEKFNERKRYYYWAVLNKHFQQPQDILFASMEEEKGLKPFADSLKSFIEK